MKYQLDEHRSDQLREWIHKCFPLSSPPAGRIDMTVEHHKDRHSTEQERYYWKMLKEYWGHEIGYSARESEDVLHRAVLCEAFGTKGTRQIGDTIVSVPDRTSSRLSKEDYALLIDTMQRMAGQMGIYIPPPEVAS